MALSVGWCVLHVVDVDVVGWFFVDVDVVVGSLL